MTLLSHHPSTSTVYGSSSMPPFDVFVICILAPIVIVGGLFAIGSLIYSRYKSK
jgi:hypothetical protein